MGTFFKTFFLCLVVTFSFLLYKFFSVDSYSLNLPTSKNSPVFGIHKEVVGEDEPQTAFSNTVEAPPVEVTSSEATKIASQVQTQKQKYTHTCYFYSQNGTLIPVKREFTMKPTLENTILLLLKGPLIAESKKGVFSEIPANVDLISLKNSENSIIVNLSSNFGKGGGSQSITNRVKQLSKTVKAFEPNKKVYLHIDGKEVEYLGGDGVYIKQPLD